MTEWSEEEEKAAILEQKCKEEECIKVEWILKVEQKRREDTIKQAEEKFSKEMEEIWKSCEEKTEGSRSSL